MTAALVRRDEGTESGLQADWASEVKVNVNATPLIALALLERMEL
jgi:hypothetical protein